MRMRGLLIAMFLGCSAPAPAPSAPAPVTTSTAPAADPATPASPTTPTTAGTSCLKNEDCDSGICEGQGCGEDAPGHCAPAQRGCTRDLRTYCGCDGQTFRASGSCPGRRFQSEGACPGSAP